jgi:hypothetical protein
MESLRLRPAPPSCRRLELRPRILGVVGADLPSMYDVCGHVDEEARPSTGLMSRERGASLRLARLVCDRRDVRLRLPTCDCIAVSESLVSTCPTMTYLPPWYTDRVVATLLLACTRRSGLVARHLNMSEHPELISPHFPASHARCGDTICMSIWTICMKYAKYNHIEKSQPNLRANTCSLIPYTFFPST